VVDGLTVDGLAPGRIEAPTSAEQVAEILRAAADAGESVVPIGGGRALGLGDVPERFDVAVETRALDRVLEQSQADMTVSVEAGITVEALNAQLAQVGQFLPSTPSTRPATPSAASSPPASAARFGSATARPATS